MRDMLTMGDDMQVTIDTMTRMYALTSSSPASPTRWCSKTRQMVADTNEIRNNLANFDDFFRPIRNYLYWSRTASTSRCWSLRSAFDALDGMDALSDDPRP